MSIVNDKKIIVTKEVVKSAKDCLEVLEKSYELIDLLNGHLCELTQELPTLAHYDEDADLERIEDFYMALPAYPQMDDLKESLFRLLDRLQIKEEA